jgi:actin-binding protein anillin
MGTVQLAVSCVMESAVECRGFLSMFDDVSGFGAWHRRWFSLRNNYLRFWKYPDDETNKVDTKSILARNLLFFVQEL